MEKSIYLDNAATTKILDEVLTNMFDSYNEYWGNPSSTHKEGKKSKSIIEKSRTIIADLLNVDPKEIVFTSGGAEANNLILKGIANANKNRGNHIITSKIEHSTVLKTCIELESQGFKVTYIDVTENGVIDIEQLKNEITDETILISIMYANNETEVLQPIDEITKLIENKNILFHTDAIQAIGKELLLPKERKINALSAAAHKFYGPKGVGFAYIDSKCLIKKEIYGGAQERNRRAGTENLQGIIGMAKAMEIIYKDMYEEQAKEKELKEYLERRLQSEITNIRINGANTYRLNCITNVTFKQCDIQTMMMMLDMSRMYVSGGSACMSGALEESHVLKAMKLSTEDLKSSLRISIGRYNTIEEIDMFVEKIKEIVTNERMLNDQDR